jgi:hypothetical protein
MDQRDTALPSQPDREIGQGRGLADLRGYSSNVVRFSNSPALTKWAEPYDLSRKWRLLPLIMKSALAVSAHSMNLVSPVSGEARDDCSARNSALLRRSITISVLVTQRGSIASQGESSVASTPTGKAGS